MTERRAPLTVAPTDLPPPARTGAVGAPKLQPGDAFIALAYATLADCAAALSAHRPAPHSAPTPEEVHQLRVAARRLRVALKAFRRMLPSRDVTRLRADLRWFAKSLGDARDLDVYADNFKAYSAALPPKQRSDLSGYELYLRREQAEARNRATACFAEPRADALFADLARFVERGPSAGALRRWQPLSIRDAVRQSIRQNVGRVRRHGKRLDARSRPSEFHELRIKIKRLRYELEFFTAVYPELTEAARACKTLQELLGTHQDAYTATARLRRYAALLKRQSRAAAPLPAALVQLRRGQLALARQVRRTFVEQWPAFLAVIGSTHEAAA
jgi:CHAD domain-containing protein